MFQAIGEGRIKAVWIIATNPVVSLPDSHAVRAALAACPFVVVSDCEDVTDLAAYAQVRLPALAWGEKSGTVTNSERLMSRQRPFLPAPGEAQPDWWMMSEVARRMGFAEAFNYEQADEIFREHARLSAYRNEGERLFDLGALADLDEAGYEAFPPVQWPLREIPPSPPLRQNSGQAFSKGGTGDAFSKEGNGESSSEFALGGTARLFGAGGFKHADGKARMLALTARPPVESVNEAYPLVLNTGRIRDQWHTMTRTGRSPRLNQHIPEPYAEIHPDDAARLGLPAGGLVRLASRYGSALARLKISPDQQPGSVFMAMHWSGPYAENALVNGLVNPVVDPVSGEPESKYTPVRVEAYRPAWHGFLIARQALVFDDLAWRVAVRGEGYWLYELAGETVPASWREWAKARMQASDGNGLEWLEYADPSQGRYRCASLQQGRLLACLFVNRNHKLPHRDWLAGLFGEAKLDPKARLGLLAGKPVSAADDQGRLVCACFGVGQNRLLRAIKEEGCASVEQIGVRLSAGTGCGSCLPELKALLAEAGGQR
jgi:assimilatory nitrate reductase catalytic subunit